MALAEDLDAIDKGIRMLHVEWEKFFSGVEKKVPTEARQRLEALIRRYAGGEIRNNNERFRYQALVARYNSMSELWNKRLRAREEGRAFGAHGIRALDVLLPQQAAAVAQAVAATHGPEIPDLNEVHEVHEVDSIHDLLEPPRPAPPPPPRPAPQPPQPVRIASPERDAFAVRSLFDRFAEARKQNGEPPVKFEAFQKLIAQQTARLISEKAAAALEFRLESKDGKVSLKARPVK